MFYSSSNERLLQWQQREVGDRPITVAVHAVAPVTLIEVLQQLERVRGEINELQSRVDILIMPRVLDAAAQVMLGVLGNRSPTTRSARFARLGAEHPRIVELARVLGVAPSDLVVSADKLITRRSSGAHFGLVPELTRRCGRCRASSPRICGASTHGNAL